MEYRYRVLDIFSGAGGISVGLESTNNFKTYIALDFNQNAIDTFNKNHKDTHCIVGDITNENVKNEIVELSKKYRINMIVGGPPCQGFSNKGKKLGLNDSRNFLFLEYLDLVKRIEPEIFILENVKNLVSAENGYFISEIKKVFEELGYYISYKIVNTQDFGIPQIRERTIVIGSKKFIYNFKFLYKHIENPVTVKDAISDLAYLNSGEGQFTSYYLFEPKSKYQEELRKNSDKLYNHMATNHSKIALDKLKLIPAEKGKEYLPDNLKGNQKFKTTWSRLEWDKPSPTIDTRFDTPSNGKNSHPVLHRAITPREAARLQSFPDDYIFVGKKTEICKQIGNAVPPLLAKKIGLSILEQTKDVLEDLITEDFSIYNNDAYNLISFFKKENIKVNHIITDPPYLISQENNFSSMKSKRQGIDFGKWDKNFDLFSWIEQYEKILDKNGSMIVFCSYRYVSFLIEKMEKNNLIVKDILEWKKSNPMPRNIQRRYVQDTEFAIWAIKKGAKWVFNKDKNIPYLRATFNFPIVSGKERTNHPTQKSINLMKEIIRIHTNENDIILDPFMGSGTTGVAALQLKRRFIGIESEKKYFDIAKTRLSNKLQ